MEKSQSPDTPESWGAASRGYADKVAPLMMETFASEFVDKLGVGPEHEVIEIAAGTGAMTGTLASRAKSLLATDFAPKMLEILRERMGGASNVTFAEMDGQALAVEDGSFNRAACCFGLMLFPDRAKGFTEMHRVLRPDGRAMVSAWAGPDKFEAFALFLAALKAAFPELPPPAAPPPVFSLSNLEDFKAQMEAAGFRDVDVHYVSRELELPGIDAVWAMMTTGAPPVQMLFERVGESGKQKVREALVKIISDKFGDGAIRVTNTATLGVGAA